MITCWRTAVRIGCPSADVYVSDLGVPMSTELLFNALMTAFEAAADCCRTRLLGNTTEHTIKEACVEALLRQGFGVMEGTTTAGKGKILRFRDGKMETELVDHSAAKSVVDPTKRSSPDIRVCEPIKMVFELQARSILGSQDGTSTPAILDDLRRVARDGAEVFILAADRKIYDAIRQIQPDKGGRKLKEPGVLKGLFPASDLLATNGYDETDGTYDEALLSMFARHVESPSGIERIVLGVMQNRAKLR